MKAKSIPKFVSKLLDFLLWTSLAIVTVAVLSGCAGLSINFDASITYRSDVPLGGRKP